MDNGSTCAIFNTLASTCPLPASSAFCLCHELIEGPKKRRELAAWALTPAKMAGGLTPALGPAAPRSEPRTSRRQATRISGRREIEPA